MKSTFPRLSITLKLFSERKQPILCLFRRKKTKIFDLARTKNWKTAEINVSYGMGMHNISSHTSFDSLVKALEAYLEKNLINFLEEEK